MDNKIVNKQVNQLIANFWEAYNSAVASVEFKEALKEAAVADSKSFEGVTPEMEDYYMRVQMMQRIIDAVDKE